MIRLKEEEKRPYTATYEEAMMKDVLSVVSQYYRVSEKDVLKKGGKAYSIPKMMSIYLCVTKLPESYMKMHSIAYVHGYKDYRNGYHGLNTIKKLKSVDRSIKFDLERLEKLIDKYIKNPDQ